VYNDDDLDDVAEEGQETAEQHDDNQFVATEKDATKVQQMFAYEAMEIVQRLGTLQDLLLRDLSLLSDEDLAHEPTCASDEMITRHRSEVLLLRLKGERFW
jgi:hypothetical protein